ncbi:MAG: hypothetical protein KJ994_03305 [Candidatus Omnitrophica bacterium]|nr:hypothetical protein [Candidatus Omnitrophota bacterium]MBU1038055.1 hypothetical protein [Candidatus Omnitrophota bacterium]MBU1809295.1 hypothetical protein [Candidatus Omnitrophota bacterium]
MKMLSRLAVIAVIVVLGFSSFALAADLSKEEIIDKAKKTLAEKGVIVVDCNILYDESNKTWEDWGLYVLKMPNDNNHGYLPHGILENYKYQAVYFDFYEDAKKDIWVFVDPVTGDVLSIYEKK